MIGLNYRDSRPIYEQIKDNYKRLILSGGIAAGDKLPSVRELASQLAINPNTIQRAYRELESEGFIYTVPGKGSFAGEIKGVDPAEVDRLLSDFDKLVSKLILLGVKRDTLCARIMDRKEKQNDRN